MTRQWLKAAARIGTSGCRKVLVGLRLHSQRCPLVLTLRMQHIYMCLPWSHRKRVQASGMTTMEATVRCLKALEGWQPTVAAGILAPLRLLVAQQVCNNAAILRACADAHFHAQRILRMSLSLERGAWEWNQKLTRQSWHFSSLCAG